ncbi:MAG: hypothetical protein LYZ69_04180 [Nitrososphaerales archaeon]|nr:hypothetical protein [Nitrososphaerales archaeon]
MAVVLSVAFIAALASYSYLAQSRFNPNPLTTTFTAATTCSAGSGACPGYEITSASLSVKTITEADVNSQELTLGIKATGNTSMDRIKVFIANVSLGSVAGPFEPGVAKVVGVAVPTTIVLNPGQRYEVVVEGIYVNAATGAVSGEYWQSVVVATG